MSRGEPRAVRTRCGRVPERPGRRQAPALRRRCLRGAPAAAAAPASLASCSWERQLLPQAEHSVQEGFHLPAFLPGEVNPHIHFAVIEDIFHRIIKILWARSYCYISLWSRCNARGGLS